MTFFRFLNALSQLYSRHLLVIILLLLVVAALDASAIISLAPILDLLTQKELDKVSPITQRFIEAMKRWGLDGTLFQFLLVFLAFILIKNAIKIFSQYLIEGVRVFVKKDLIGGIYSSFLCARWHFFVSQGHGTLGNVLVREATYISNGFFTTASLIANFFRAICYLGICVYISWQLFFIVLALVAVFLLPFLVLGRLSYQWGEKRKNLENNSMQKILETLGLAKLIIGYGHQKKSITELGKVLEHQRRVDLKAYLLKNSTVPFLEPIGVGILIVTCYIATRQFSIPFSELFIMFYALREGIPLVSHLVGQKNDIQSYLPAWEQLSRLKQQARKEAQQSGNALFYSFSHAVRFKNVDFAYPEHETLLHKIDLEIPKGKMVALAGVSGGGKTTLIDLLMVLYEPTHGEIELDGRPLSHFDVESWRKKIGYVPQESVLFDATIRENLLWSMESANDAEMIRACQLAYADDFIRELPQGYDTLVGNRGVRLSGGQRQRVALARAILRKPELLILDEATSALDSQSELYIQQAIEEISKETTVLVVAHRLSTIAKADCIYVLDNGRIVERGTFEQVTADGGSLFEAARVQGLA